MNTSDMRDEISRFLAAGIFPNTHQGRTLSRMIADYYGTDTKTVHTMMIGILGITTIFYIAHKK